MSKQVEALACSFCGAKLSSEPGRVVAGPTVFICRDCVGLCIGIMAEKDPAWREQKIKFLENMRPRRFRRWRPFS